MSSKTVRDYTYAVLEKLSNPLPDADRTRDIKVWPKFQFERSVNTEELMSNPLFGQKQWFSVDFNETGMEEQDYSRDTEETGIIMIYFFGFQGRSETNVSLFAESVKRAFLGGMRGNRPPEKLNPGQQPTRKSGWEDEPGESQWNDRKDRFKGTFSPDYGLSIPGAIMFSDSGLSDGGSVDGVYSYMLSIEYQFQSTNASDVKDAITKIKSLTGNGLDDYLRTYP